MSISFNLKFYVGDEIFCSEINVDALAEFSFAKLLEALHALTPDEQFVGLKWVDLDGELISLRNDPDLAVALRNLHRGSKDALRVRLPQSAAAVGNVLRANSDEVVCAAAVAPHQKTGTDDTVVEPPTKKPRISERRHTGYKHLAGENCTRKLLSTLAVKLGKTYSFIDKWFTNYTFGDIRRAYENADLKDQQQQKFVGTFSKDQWALLFEMNQRANEYLHLAFNDDARLEASPIPLIDYPWLKLGPEADAFLAEIWKIGGHAKRSVVFHAASEISNPATSSDDSF